MAVQVLADAMPETEMTTIEVLLVEDNDGDAALLEASLTDAGAGSGLHPFVRIIRARSLADARAILAGRRPAAIVLDLGLPDSIGLATVEAIRAECDVPIVILTGLADEHVALQALKAGAQDYLFKGDVGPGLMLRTLRYAIERKSLEREVARNRWMAGIGETVLAVLHEVNNPLTSLIMNGELMASGETDRATVDAMVESARRISEVTRRLARQTDPRTVEYVTGVKMLDLGLTAPPEGRVEG